jgi:4,5-DOPA dioxygenase extradiol
MINRKDFIKQASLITVFDMIGLKEFANMIGTDEHDMMPAYFIGHGSPMNALANNKFTASLNAIGMEVSKPKCILVISAHWLTKGTYVQSAPSNKTIYDFGGFPEELYRVKYEPKGSPDTANELSEKIKHTNIQTTTEWGLDHGAWTILKHMYPLANVPAFQMSIDFSKPPAYHFQLAKELHYLRKKGVLIIGSGNIVHNLGRLNWQQPESAYDWSIEFDDSVKRKLQSHAYNDLINYTQMGSAALLSVPTLDHYLPMLYVLGVTTQKENIHFTYEGIEMGSVSMRCFKVS